MVKGIKQIPALNSKLTGLRSSEVHMDVIEGDRGRAGVSHHMSSQQGKLRFNRNPMNGTGSGSRTPLGEDWELDCEICHRRGINTVGPPSIVVVPGLTPYLG